MSVTVTLTFANVQEMQAYFVGREVIAASAPATEKPASPKSAKASSSSSTASSTTQPAAANAASEGNASAANVEAATPFASTASSETSTSAPDFETVKKAFLALSVKDGGRARCEQVLKPFALGKLSEAKPEQYGQILDAIKKAAA